MRTRYVRVPGRMRVNEIMSYGRVAYNDTQLLKHIVLANEDDPRTWPILCDLWAVPIPRLWDDGAVQTLEAFVLNKPVRGFNGDCLKCRIRVRAMLRRIRS